MYGKDFLFRAKRERRCQIVALTSSHNVYEYPRVHRSQMDFILKKNKKTHTLQIILCRFHTRSG